MNNEIEIQAAIEQSVADLSAARESVRQLANELVDVIEVIEPALSDQTRLVAAETP